MPITAIIVDDESPARDRIRDLLAAESDVTVVAECADGKEAISAITTHRPDLVFLDIQMPEVGGFDVLRALDAAEIDWIESSANYATLHVGDKSHLHRETMRALEEQLDPTQFIRISRSAIANIARIRELKPLAKGEYAVFLRDGTKLTMTRGIRELQQALVSRIHL